MKELSYRFVVVLYPKLHGAGHYTYRKKFFPDYVIVNGCPKSRDSLASAISFAKKQNGVVLFIYTYTDGSLQVEEYNVKE